MVVDRSRVPSLALCVLGVAIAAVGLWEYAGHVLDPPPTELGFLAEVVTLGYLLIAGGLVTVGVYGWRRDRPDVSTSVLVGVIVLWGTFQVGLYETGNTRAVVAVGLSVSLAVGIATGALFEVVGGWDRDLDLG